VNARAPRIDVWRLLCFVVLNAALVRSSGAQQSITRTLSVGGLVRTYHLHVPRSHAPQAPLVMVFHGGGGQGSGIERSSGFDALSDREGFVVAYPDGVDNSWNDGRTDAPLQGALRKQIDDTSFVRAVIADIATVTPVDGRRVFATGMSNGGIFSQFLGATMSDVFAAIAPVAGGIADPFYRRFAPASPVSVLAMNGTRDPLVPFGGGNVTRAGRGKVISVDEAMRLWSERDGTVPEPKTGTLPDADATDGCLVKTRKWTGGKNGTDVWLYIEEGAGHTWPGGPQNLPKAIVGAVCRDFDATEEAWKFFKAHPKP
jgi:polyhydroxybutyrate depolymerase